MAKIEFPKHLQEQLEGSDLQAPIRALADRVGEILADNKLPFFPDYTDHGIDHIHCVFKSEVELIPKHIWEGSKSDSDPRLLCDADAAVIIGATLLHDIAMHLGKAGFLELISGNSRFQPLPWFMESHVNHSADQPWLKLWEDYTSEARRFSDRDLANIIGEESARVWKFHSLPEDLAQWEANHCLIIGEFIRRHHTRLAHEIAIYGFPGLPAGSGEGYFPAMGKEEGHPLMRLADLIGLTARSHGMSLRVCKSYLESSPLYPGTPRPMGTAIYYPMALLRVADYLQIDRQRAPAVLLQLKNPQSPVSIQEWKKHRAVQHVGPATDPRGKVVTVSPDLSLPLYLQLRDLLAGLQTEMDHSTAVLDEAYGTLTELGLNQLNLATRRVYSNLQSPAFRDSLPYVPNRTGFTADPNLLTLLVEPLYGNEPSVGVRELMQNAVDAVCELDAWCAAHGKNIASLDLPKQDGDVLIEFIKREDGSWFLRVQDRGIGMRSDTIQNYFLRAGASFRRSAEWSQEFLNDQGQAQVIRAGRFGIGAFAVFLLGPSFRLWTRHVGEDNSMGCTIEASASSQLIEIHRVDSLPIGTTVEVEMSHESVKSLNLEAEKYSSYCYDGLERKVDWFCWDWPKVVKRVVRGATPEVLVQEYAAPIIRKDKLAPEWAVIHPEGFDAVYWTFDDAPKIACNGLRVMNPSFFPWLLEGAEFDWPLEAQLESPCIAVLDSGANLPLTTQRYKLSQETLPFEDDLARDVVLSFIAHTLVCGPTSPAGALSLPRRHPLGLGQFTKYEGMDQEAPFSEGRLRWCMTTEELIPADPWLYPLLNAKSCLVFGGLNFEDSFSLNRMPVVANLCGQGPMADLAIMPWDGILTSGLDHDETDRDERVESVADLPASILADLVCKGVTALGCKVGASRVLVSAAGEFNFGLGGQPSRKGGRSQFEGWTKTGNPDSPRPWFEAKKGTLSPSMSLHSALGAIETALLGKSDKGKRSSYRDAESLPDVLFVCEIKTNRVRCAPESLLSRIWSECLGARAIQFDKAARKTLITEGSKHPELKRHIKAWQEMKRTGSKWATQKQ
jgi:molecular chaperone HtpG